MGVIRSAHGISGNIVIRSFTHIPADITKLSIMYQDHEICQLTLVRPGNKDEVICQIDGCHTRTQAQALKGLGLYCYRSTLPPVSENIFYFEDLKGLPVLDQHQQVIGKIIGVFNFGAGDILEIQFNNSKTTEFLPFNEHHFPIITKDHVTFRQLTAQLPEA